MSTLGIYFGPKVISIVETTGKKLLNNIQIPQPITSAGDLEEKVPLEVKEIEIIALFKDELRRKKIEAKEATLCLSGKDLIIRTFELPLLPREELSSAINFEAKKYIPFKVEELIWEFQLKPERASRTNLVLFAGVKKEILERYISILKQLDLKINSVEYSAFSMVRCLKLNGLSDSGIIGILSADVAGKDEVNFTVLENGFPLFSRDIAFAESHEEQANIENAAPLQALEKLKTEVHVSLDYYHRKYSTKKIKRIYILSNQEYRSELEAYMASVGIATRFVDAVRPIDKSLSYSLSLVKTYCASLSKVIKTEIKVNLLAAKERALKEKAAPKEALSLLRGFRIDSRVVILGALICLLPLVIGFYRSQNLRKELRATIGSRPGVSTVNPQVPYKELTNINSEYKRKLNNLDTLIKKQLYLTDVLNAIPSALPDGLWLASLSFNAKEEGKEAELVLEGKVYLVASDKEFETANKFLFNLKANPEFAKYFKSISMDSLTFKEVDKLITTDFTISCKTYKEKE